MGCAVFSRKKAQKAQKWEAGFSGVCKRRGAKCGGAGDEVLADTSNLHFTWL